MGCAMPQEEQQQQNGEHHHHQSQKTHSEEQKKMGVLLKVVSEEKLAVEVQQQQQKQQQQNSNSGAAGNLKGTHSALVKLLESAPIAQIRPELKQKLSDFSGKHSDQNHYRKGGELGTSKCPWKKSRICAEWLLRNQQEAELGQQLQQHEEHQQQPHQQVASNNTNQTVMIKTNPSNETEPMPKAEFLAPTGLASVTQEKHELEEDVEMTDLEGLVCTCHELPEQERSPDEDCILRRNSSDSTDDELNKCGCSHCSLNPPVLPQQRTSLVSVSDSGCEDSDCAENKIADLCNRFNENLAKEDVSLHIIVLVPIVSYLVMLTDRHWSVLQSAFQ